MEIIKNKSFDIKNITAIISNLYNKNKTLFIILIGIAIYLLRSWQRVFVPEVWVEDGAFNIPSIINKGWKGIFDEVNGYMVIVPKLITYISLNISILEYPFISTLLTSILTIYIFYAVATSPIQLKGRLGLAVFIFLFPAGTECFAKPLYTFWWVNILLFLTLFWKPEARSISSMIKRILYIIMAALSSPLAIIILPVFLYRAIAYYKKFKTELIIFFVAIIANIPQIMTMLASENTSAGISSYFSISVFLRIIKKYFGYYLTTDHNIANYFGVLFFIFMLIIFVKNIKKQSFIILYYLLATTIFIIMFRVDISITHPIHAGPRYFFYQYILISWILVHFIYTNNKDKVLNLFSKQFLFVMILTLLPHLSSEHGTLYWKKHILSLPFFNTYIVPINYERYPGDKWIYQFTKNKAGQLVSNDPFYYPDISKSYAYFRTPKRYITNVNNTNTVSLPKENIKQFEKISNNGKDYYSIAKNNNSINGYNIIGTYTQGNPDHDTPIVLKVKMKKGESIWYRSEAKAKKQHITIEGFEDTFYTSADFINNDWSLLTFSNEKLPEEFYVHFSDGGNGWGEWFAIATK